MKNGVVLYLEDSEDGTTQIIGRIVGDPKQSKELADEILMDLIGTNSNESMPSQALH